MSIIKRKAGSEDIVKSVLEFDAVPTEGSHNLVESGSVAQAIGNLGQPLQWKGPATVATLNAGITGIQPGWTYTLTDAGTLTDGSIEVEAGDEVAWTEDDEWFKVGVENSKGPLAEAIAPEYDPTATYPTVGTAVMHNGLRYVSNTAINTAEDWTPAHWTEKSVEDEIGNVETDLETGSVVATKKLAGASANLTFSCTPGDGESDYYLLHKNYYGSVTTFDIYARDSSGVHSQITYKTNVSFETWQKLVLPEGYDNWLFYKGTQAGDANGVDVVLYNVSESSLAGRVFLLERKEEYLGAEIESFKPYWFKGKKVMCIGDSITQFTYQKKGYVKYLEEFTGAKTFNAGVGGTRYAPRAVSSSTVTNSDQAYANLDIYNRVHAWCTDEWANIDAAVNYMITQGANYSSYINALKNNPVTGVDIVVLFAGTNDFASGVALGDVGSTNASETLGAINKIIEELLAANGALKIFVFTPTIRYIDNNRTDPYYSDNWENSQGITLKEEAAKILECVEANHIPICDFYNTLGWNKYNFSTYFTPREGTHPETGYDSIARRMAGFIQSNGF